LQEVPIAPVQNPIGDLELLSSAFSHADFSSNRLARKSIRLSAAGWVVTAHGPFWYFEFSGTPQEKKHSYRRIAG